MGKDVAYAKARVKCDCGHYSKDHYLGEGWCHHSQHPQAGKCGCTWYWPNVRWVTEQLKEGEDVTD